MVKLREHQELAISKLRPGSILVGGVGSGKSLTALVYFFKLAGGRYSEEVYESPKEHANIYIITTAQKRDKHEWELEAANLLIFQDEEENRSNISLKIDSWNNIGKYSNIKNSYFIFDEQRLVSYGAWVKHFLKISKSNKWILLTATPGDNYSNYIPILVANNFYKNKTEFISKHIVYKPFMNYPVIDRYLDTKTLDSLIKSITVKMDFERSTVRHVDYITVDYDKSLYFNTLNKRMNYFTEEPIVNASGLCQALRRVVNSNFTRVSAVRKLIEEHPKTIVFYNFNYELDLLRDLCNEMGIPFSEWNGKKHEKIFSEEPRWVYLVQYTAGAEGWNCIETDTMIFFSFNYSYKIMEQAAGRIDRLNTPFVDLYYFYLRTRSPIDISIHNCLREKRDFNEKIFFDEQHDFHPL